MRIILLLCFIFPVSASYALDIDCQAHRCMAVIDAGSTKSYLHVYQYDLDSTQTPIHIQEKWSKKVQPGLATLDAEQVSSYFNELFNGLNQPNLPVYLYATAGMRLLPEASQAKLYQAARTWFDHSIYKLVSAKTIAGVEEGVYGWVSANYQLGHLTQNNALVGVMDMGGASVQVVFPAPDTQGIARENLKTVHIYGKSITLFVHSFLGLGQTEVIHQLLDEAGCFSRGYPLPNQTLATGETTGCEEKVNLLLQVHDVSKTVQPALIKNPRTDWFVMGGLSSLAKSFPFHFENSLMAPKALMNDGINAYCHTDWSQLSNEHPNNPYLASSCLASVYFYELLVNGYGLNAEQPIQFSQDSVTDDWTIGVVFSNNISTDMP